jgi:TPR repeat protein
MAVDRSGVPYCLGLALARGAGVPKRDPAEALRFWRAVEGGFRVDAALELADALFRGLGTPADGAKAVEIIRPFAESGNPRAQNTFATLIAKNADPAIPPSEALPWWRKAAAQSLFVAARNVYASQVRGVICPKDPAGALRELESFLDGGTPFARFQGGLLLLNEGEFSFVENTRLEEPGRRWIAQAAQTGYAPAQAWLRSHAPLPQP